MPRFAININDIKEEKVTISGNDHKHMTTVLRLGINDTVTLFTGQTEYRAEIIKINSKEVVLRLIDTITVSRESPLKINLYQGILRSAKMDFIIQKCTELGANTLTPVVNHRSQIRHTNKIKRWKRITEESCKQCGRNIPLLIKEIRSFEQLIKEEIPPGANLLFDVSANDTIKSYIESLKSSPGIINIFIGPEGGFSDKEVRLLENKEIRTVRFGPRILRAETAAISAISVIQYLLGDLK